LRTSTGIGVSAVTASGGAGGAAGEANVQRGVLESDARDDKKGSEELHVRDGTEEWLQNTNRSDWERGGEAHGN